MKTLKVLTNHGNYELKIDEINPREGTQDRFEVFGTVINGIEINRLFGSVSRTDITGRSRYLYSVSQDELDSGIVDTTHICG